MEAYVINDIKVGIANNGKNYGPFELPINVSVQYTHGGKTQWLTNTEVTGIPNFYITENDIFEKLNDIDSMKDNSFTSFLEKTFIESFDGVKLGDYDEIKQSLAVNPNSPVSNFIKLIICLSRCNNDDTELLTKESKGKSIAEIDISKYYTSISAM